MAALLLLLEPASCCMQPVLYIIVGADTGLYFLETRGEKRELVQVCHDMTCSS